jgi:hypothetical protein
MDQNIANKIVDYFQVKGYETDTWIGVIKGGNCYEATHIDLIKNIR